MREERATTKATGKIAGLHRDIRAHWKQPADGKYMSYREIAAYSVGGFGAYSVFTMAQALLLSTANVIIGNTIGIQPMHMYVMYLISVITNIPLTMLRANMVDNVRYKSGKYRPYLLRMGIPTIAISLLFVFTPYAAMGYIWRCALIFLYNIGLQFFYNFFYDAYENLIHVLSPDSQERTNVTAIKSMIYSLSPTITNFVTPLVANKVADGNMYDLRVYRWLYPFISVFGVGLLILVYARTEEKIVVAKTHPMKIKFSDALREVAKNKYFWIISLAGWLGFLETCTYVVLQWLYNYGRLCTAEQYSFITLIRGTAYVWGMVLAPFAVKKWGKKRVLLATNMVNIVFLALVYPLMGSIWTVLLCMYFNSIADSFILVLTPAIQADIRDYQHYQSGERIDGMFGAVAMIGSFVTMATSSVLPAIYEKYGIFAGNGYENMYDVLYDPAVLTKLVGVLVILSAIGAALNVIPYFFYDLSECKQKSVIRILQLRATLEDFGNGVLSDDDLRGAIRMVADARERVQGCSVDLASLKKEKAPKKARKAAAIANEEYEIACALIGELERFSTPAGKARLIWAQGVKAGGLEEIARTDGGILASAKALPADTPMQRQIRKESIADAKLSLRCKRAALRYYPNGADAFDADALNRLYDEEQALTKRKTRLLKSGADRQALAEVSAALRTLSDQIKMHHTAYQHFLESTKVIHEAQKLLTQAQNYETFCALCVAPDGGISAASVSALPR